jgi:hypothetical protein
LDIADWLRGLSLERYTETFRANAVEIAVLPELNEADLENLGVLLGHRKMMLRAIAALGAPTLQGPAAVYGWFTEGCDPADLKEARRCSISCDWVGRYRHAGMTIIELPFGIAKSGTAETGSIGVQILRLTFDATFTCEFPADLLQVQHIEISDACFGCRSRRRMRLLP